jgi:hypothetical protein
MKGNGAAYGRAGSYSQVINRTDGENAKLRNDAIREFTVGNR